MPASFIQPTIGVRVEGGKERRYTEKEGRGGEGDEEERENYSHLSALPSFSL